MDDRPKFFILGFLFFLAIMMLRQFMLPRLYYYQFDLFAGITVAVTVAVGIVKGPRAGTAFGFSSLIPYLLTGLFFGYFVIISLFSLLAEACVMALYGYLPSKYYHQSKRIGKAFVGFLTSLMLDAVVSLVVAFLSYYFIFGSSFMIEIQYFLPYVLNWQLLNTLSTLVIGGISTGLTVRYAQHHPAYPAPRPAIRPSATPYQKTLHCTKCGHENPSNFDFCGTCGSPLKEEETKVY